jgi:hypothetical protein
MIHDKIIGGFFLVTLLISLIIASEIGSYNRSANKQINIVGL